MRSLRSTSARQQSVTDGYSKVKDDLQFRQQHALRIGTGFNMPVAPASVRTVRKVEVAKAA
jgi:hypothetical protein